MKKFEVKIRVVVTAAIVVQAVDEKAATEAAHQLFDVADGRHKYDEQCEGVAEVTDDRAPENLPETISELGRRRGDSDVPYIVTVDWDSDGEAIDRKWRAYIPRALHTICNSSSSADKPGTDFIEEWIESALSDAAAFSFNGFLYETEFPEEQTYRLPPDPDEANNERAIHALWCLVLHSSVYRPGLPVDERLKIARCVINQFAIRTRSMQDSRDEVEETRDLLCNILHLADRQGGAATMTHPIDTLLGDISLNSANPKVSDFYDIAYGLDSDGVRLWHLVCDLLLLANTFPQGVEIVWYSVLGVYKSETYADPCLMSLCAQTGTDHSDWEEFVGVPTGVGLERFYRHKEDGREAYCVDDQGTVRIGVKPDKDE